MPASTPIILIHRGDSFYLPYTIAQARQSNPHNPILLIGDNCTKFYHGIQHFHLKNYYQGARKLEQRFVHLDASPQKWEIKCFQRWLILHEFLCATGQEHCLYIDSDVLVFRTADEIAEAFVRFPLTLSFGYPIDLACGHATIVNDREPLRQIGEFCFSVLEVLQQWVDRETPAARVPRMNQPGGISDMTALGAWVRHHPGLSGNAMRGDLAFEIDHTLQCADNRFQMDGDFKKLTWKNNLPFGILTSGEVRPFALLHCSGRAKYQMHRFIRISNPAFRRELRYDLLRARFRKFREKLPRWLQIESGLE